MLFIIIVDLGEGLGIARLNDQEEYDFIRQAQRGWSHDRNYWIAGRYVNGSNCLTRGSTFNFSDYSADISKSNIYLLHIDRYSS